MANSPAPHGIHVDVDPYVYLNAETLRLRDVSRETIERVAADAVASIPGVELVCTRWEALGDRLPEGKVYDMIRLGFHPRLSRPRASRHSRRTDSSSIPAGCSSTTHRGQW